MIDYNKLSLLFAMITVLITGSLYNIGISVLVSIFPSIYFLMLMITIESMMLYGLIMLIMKVFNLYVDAEEKVNLIVYAGATGAWSNLCFLYSANTNRTPAVIQSIFLGLIIIPSVIFTKYILKKNNTYNLSYTFCSIFMILLSIVLSIIPLFNGDYTFNGWIFMYLFGVILLSLTYIFQEKFIMKTNKTFYNKLKILFFGEVIQLFIVFGFFLLEPILGYSNSIEKSWEGFVAVLNNHANNPYPIIYTQLFVFNYIIFSLSGIYLNQISTNYNTILSGLSNQSVAIFYMIFPHLNNGIVYPLVIALFSIGFNAMGIFCWIKAETHEDIKDDDIAI